MPENRGGCGFGFGGDAELLEEFFVNDTDFIALFRKSSAAKTVHHGFIGGLLEHTYECLKFADAVLAECRGKINPDSVYAACILHDFGKIFEYIVYKETGLIEYNEEFNEVEYSNTSEEFYTNEETQSVEEN